MDETNLSTSQPSDVPPGNEDRPAQGPDAAMPDAREDAAVAPGNAESENSLAPEPADESLSLPEVAAQPMAAAAETEVSEPAEAVTPEAVPHEAPREAAAASAEPPAEALPKSDKMDWYILKVQSNREETIRDGLRKKIKIAGLERYFGEIIIPTEKVTEFKGGKRKVFKRKLYPGYLVVQMEINEDTWFLVRETTGIGDFTGAVGHPTPMQPREVAAILAKQEEKADEAPKLKIGFRVGDHVKIKEGTFENFEGEVANIDETNGRVTVLINIFGRSTPVDIEYWQIEKV